MAIFGQDYFRTRGSMMGFGAIRTILVRIQMPLDRDGRLLELKVPYTVEDIEWPTLRALGGGEKLMVFSSRRGNLPETVNFRTSDPPPPGDFVFTNAANADLAIMPPPQGQQQSMPMRPLPSSRLPAPMPVIPDQALVVEPPPAPTPSPTRSMMPSEPPPSGASAANLQRQAGMRVTVSPEFVDSLVQKFPQYFNFPNQPQGSVSTSTAVESTSIDRTGIGARAPVPIEQRRAESPTQKVAAYCVQQAPEGGASTGNMVPVDANCQCPEGYSRVGECPPKQEAAGGSKWWILLLAGAGIWAYSRRK